MIDLGKQDWLHDERLARLFGVIERAGGEARIAGGAVRNGLWGLPVSDIDVATTLLPQDVMEAGKGAGFSVHPTGIDHGTVTMVVDELVVEVTTLRADVETDGRHAQVAFTTDWKQGAARRDFTINALYCNLAGEVFEEVKGALDDHKLRRVVFVGNARDRIREDYLRILRLFRFSAFYGNGDLDAGALKAASELKDGLDQLSRERVTGELLKILVAPHAQSVVAVMLETGILQKLIDVRKSVESFFRLEGTEQKLGITTDAILRLSLLTEKADHLRLSNRDLERFNALVSGGEELEFEASETEQKRLIYRLGTKRYQDFVVLAQVRQGNANDWSHHYKLAETWPVPAFPVSGADLIARGFKPGVELGLMLKKLEQLWLESGFETSRDDLLELAVSGKLALSKSGKSENN